MTTKKFILKDHLEHIIIDETLGEEQFNQASDALREFAASHGIKLVTLRGNNWVVHQINYHGFIGLFMAYAPVKKF